MLSQLLPAWPTTAPLRLRRDHAELRQPGTASWPWTILAALLLIDAAIIPLTHMQFAPGSWRFYALQALQCALAIYLAGRFSKAPRTQTLFKGMAFLSGAWPVLRLFNHLTAAAGMPLVDAHLAAIDSSMGFDWFAYLAWADGHPGLLSAMQWTYSGLSGFVFILFLITLTAPDAEERCRELAYIFIITAVICTVIGAMLPAVGAMAFYAPQHLSLQHISPQIGTYALSQTIDIRENGQHIIDPLLMPGLVTFPSFHTAMGVIAVYCARGRWIVLCPSLAFNTVMIASTPIYGSHYLIDVICGALTAIAVCIGYRRRSAIARTLQDLIPSWQTANPAVTSRAA